MRTSRGFSLIELMIAGAASLILISGAFVALAGIHKVTAQQNRAADVASRGRLALAIIGRDLRAAGDSVQLLPTQCQGATTSRYGCPAILEAHPWRVTIARNSWGAGPDGVMLTADDEPPTQAFNQNPENVVSYAFHPTTGYVPSKSAIASATPTYVRGRLLRIVNPLGFLGQEPQITVLIDNVVLDNRMRMGQGTKRDPRFDMSLFLYELKSEQNGEFVGDASVTQRSLGQFMLPPMRFYDFPADPLEFRSTVANYAFNMPNASSPFDGVKIVGLQAPAFGSYDPPSSTKLFTVSKGTWPADLRFALDDNRPRAVRVAFKLHEALEDPKDTTGVNLIGTAADGTAPLHLFESTFEIKPMAGYVN